jgi:two-component sensor histidine kinase
MISSMINLKAMEMGDERMFSDLESQIRAISIVHEILHQAGDVTRVDFEGYVQRLLETVFASFTHGTVHLDLDIQEVSFSSRTTVTLGLLVNEIATNAIKHGFTPGEQARFSLHLRREKENFILILSNSGRSFPEDVNLYNTETLGMSLISALSVRLRGTVELQKKPVTTFTITFPEE